MAEAKEKPSSKDPAVATLSPRTNALLFGHEETETRLHQRLTEGRLPHALLFTGPKGIGKATLAFRLARALLAEGKALPQEEAPSFDLFGAPAEPSASPLSGFSMAEDHPVFRRIAAGSHGDMLYLAPEPGKSETSAHEIRVEAIREVAQFLGMTPAESNWRVVIIDESEHMNRNAANALLKLLEEPPARSALLLVSHQPGMLLPTIRSRCQTIRLQPPGQEHFSRILNQARAEGDAPLTETHRHFLFHTSRGAPGLALLLQRHDAPERYHALLILLKQIASEGSGGSTHASVEALASAREGEAFTVTARLLLLALERIARSAASVPQAPLFPGEDAALAKLAARMPLDSWLALWENASSWLRVESALHFDRTQLLTLLLHAMAARARLPAFAA